MRNIAAAPALIVNDICQLNNMSLIKIEYPFYEPVIKKKDGIEFIFDAYRKKWVVLTPEEWVRQNFMEYLVNVLGYPATLIAIEKEIYIGKVKKRFDIVVYNRQALPFIVVECKEMKVALDEKVLQQALRYNTTLQAKMIIITNGKHCFAFKRVGNNFVALEQLPFFER
ncbi:MAG: type I restriction enzyme HsdR N-terminal domain-containing protein [Ferruginibacter sp.]